MRLKNDIHWTIRWMEIYALNLPADRDDIEVRIVEEVKATGKPLEADTFV